jgi:hypothetical protein
MPREPATAGQVPSPRLAVRLKTFLDRAASRWQGWPVALCERDRAVLDVERTWWLDGRSKADVVRARLRVSLSRYNEILRRLLGSQDAEAYDPLVVRRLRRARERRRWATLGLQPATGRRPR